ncbi:MAG: fimbria major subunit [Muribaculaceae bacterium]|nr:fimbria major subunit [Muribaculaceae bacterium]
MTANQTMNLFHNIIKNSLFTSLSWVRALFNQLQSFIPHLSIIPYTLYLLLSVSLLSCIDENLTCPDEDSDLNNPNSSLIELAGIIGFQIYSNDPGTRADDPIPIQPSDKVGSFNDGIEKEYKLAESGFHFAVIYRTGEENQVPLAVLPLSFSIGNYEDLLNTTEHLTQGGKTLKWDNVTMVAKSMYASGSDGSISNLREILDGNEIFVLLNFDKSLIYADANIVVSSNDDTGTVLSKITHKNFINNLCVKDYSISVKDGKIVSRGTSGSEEYFTMSNSVYLDPSNSYKKTYSYSIVPENIFATATEAENNPAITVYLERIASKYTVGIDPTNTQLPEGVEYSENSDGTYYFKFQVNKYKNYTFNSNPDTSDSSGTTGGGTNLGYSINSDPVNATVSIVGYGVSNLEKREYLLKYLDDNTNYYKTKGQDWLWNDASAYRSYWTKDKNYDLLSNDNRNHTNAKGYPHQFRLALETDTVNSLFTNENSLGYKYKNPSDYFDIDHISSSKSITYYKEIGEINNNNLDADCVLRYLPFQTMLSAYKALEEEDDGTKPLYSLENTYWDPGMWSGFDETDKGWIWEWQKAPFSAATCFILLCKLEIEGFSGDALYRGQNNIFYPALYDTEGGDHTGLITSKLGILNEVMLNGGNAGFQIFDGMWDSHVRGGQTTLLDKIAWNENGYLWIKEPSSDNSSGYIIRRMIDSDFDLIPAELAGGDGQCLIAPKEEKMGIDFRYYIAPKTADSTTENPVMDDELKVEISFNHLVGLIHKIIGPIDVFTNGYMYYAVPISHNEGSFKGSSEISKTNESWRTLGNIGVVRNNWYNITVNAITGVGTPVHAVAQPIVPVMEVKRSYINLNVKLMNWHTITQDNVPL